MRCKICSKKLSLDLANNGYEICEQCKMAVDGVSVLLNKCRVGNEMYVLSQLFLFISKEV